MSWAAWPPRSKATWAKGANGSSMTSSSALFARKSGKDDCCRSVPRNCRGRRPARVVEGAMHYLALATDYDGTIAHDGVVDAPTLAALERCAAPAAAVLVTGRELEDLMCLPRLDLFDRVVAENGALLYGPADRRSGRSPPPPPPVRRGLGSPASRRSRRSRHRRELGAERGQVLATSATSVWSCRSSSTRAR